MALCRRMGAWQHLTLELGAVLGWMLALGDLQSARERWPEYQALVTKLDEPVTRGDSNLWASTLALA